MYTSQNYTDYLAHFSNSTGQLYRLVVVVGSGATLEVSAMFVQLPVKLLNSEQFTVQLLKSLFRKGTADSTNIVHLQFTELLKRYK